MGCGLPSPLSWVEDGIQGLPCMLKPTNVHNPWIKWYSICTETTDSDIYCEIDQITYGLFYNVNSMK